MRTILMVLCFLLTTQAYSSERVITYVGKKFLIEVPLGEDVSVGFDEGQLVGVSESSAEYMAIESLSKSNEVRIYGRKKTVEPMAVEFRGMDSKRPIQAFISVVEGSEAPLLLRVINSKHSRAKGSSVNNGRYSEYWDSDSFSNTATTKLLNDERAKALIRFVNQDFGPSYAKERPPFAIKRVTDFTPVEVKGLYRKGLLSATAVRVYYGGRMTAVVFELTNKSASAHEFNPFYVRGSFEAINPWKRNFSPNESGVLVGVVHGKLDRGMFRALGEVIQ
jgi:hypothetical protein